MGQPSKSRNLTDVIDTSSIDCHPTENLKSRSVKFVVSKKHFDRLLDKTYNTIMIINDRISGYGGGSVKL